MRQMKDSNSDWLGLIPADWIVDRLGVIANRFYRGIGITRDDVDLDGDTPCVRYGDIYTKYNISFSSCSSRTNKEKLSATIFAEYGDVLFALTGEKVEEIGKSIVCLSEEPCLVGGDIAIMKHTQNPSYMGYLLSSDFAQQQKSSGKAKLKVVHTHIKDLRNIIIPIPPLSEQRTIADYLDVKCGEVDALVSLQEEMISELQAYKHAVITEAVTHGLNPNAKMKDSNVQWIGSVPEHWDTLRLRFVCELRNGYTPSKANPDFWTDGTIPWYRMDDIRESGRRLKEAKQYITEEAVKGGGLFEAGSFIMATTATIGEHAVLIVDSLANQQFTNLKIRKSLSDSLLSDYFFYYLFVVDDYCKTTTRTATFPAVNMEDLKNFAVCIPPVEEQRKIVESIEKRCADIDALIGLKQQKIEELKEWKKSLIFECVTGKREIQQA